MLSTVARIFVSSTWLDLQPERQAVEDAINRMSGGKFIGMEYFGSRPETTEGASLDEVDRADIYVGIIGGRYGSGITEKEYRRARERDMPCFIFLCAGYSTHKRFVLGGEECAAPFSGKTVVAY